MRITCPNCNAQYEVGEDMIPSEGRDVQCSNCGTTWFQDGRPRTASAVEDRAIRRPGRKPPPLPPEEDDEDDDAQTDESPTGATAQDRRAAKPRRAQPDQATLDILREERDLEERLRAGTTPEGDLPEGDGSADADDPADSVIDETDAPEVPASEPPADPREQAAAERARMAAAAALARGRGGSRGPRSARAAEAEPPVEVDLSDVVAETLRDAATPATEDEADGDAFADADLSDPVSARSARRELLPDIEEINSSLRPDERAAEAEAEAAAAAEAPIVAQRSSGFRLGFLLVCLVIAASIGVYVFAGQIAEAVPQVAGALMKYVAWVDAQRVTLAAAAEALTESIAPDR